ncbi:MAG: hypothetical protein V3V01_08145 [Acidimicrobiales bacterium]
MRALVVLIVLALSAASLGSTVGAAPKSDRCRLFPRSSFWHADVSKLAVHPRSDAWLATSGLDRSAHADFGSGRWDGGPIGIPITKVKKSQPLVDVDFRYDDESDSGPYPIPANVKIEGGRNGSGDRHAIVLQRSTCTLYEVFDAHPQGDGNWSGGSGAVYDLRSNDLRPDTWTSADASGLPILPGLVRYSEVKRGRINHAIRITLPTTQRAHVWPARHDAGSTNSRNAPPMGAWLRLSADIEPNDFPPQARVIVKALQKHGGIVVDNGSAFFLTGTPSRHWDNDDLHSLHDLDASDFEFIRSGRMKVSSDSGKVRKRYR